MTNFENTKLSKEELEEIREFLKEIDPENKVFDLTQEIIKKKIDKSDATTK